MTIWTVCAFIAGVACGVIGACLNFMWTMDADGK